MALCTIEQVRATNDKLSSSVDVPDLIISNRITEADATIIVDLSPSYSEAAILSLGVSNKFLNLLSTWKSAELVLVRLYGATRQVDQVSDVDYWRKKYDNLIKRILDGEIALSTAVSAVNIPVITGNANRLKLFPTKGIFDFGQGSVNDEF